MTKALKDLEKRERVAAKDVEHQEIMEVVVEARSQRRATTYTGDGGSVAGATRGVNC